MQRSAETFPGPHLSNFKIFPQDFSQPGRKFSFTGPEKWKHQILGLYGNFLHSREPQNNDIGIGQKIVVYCHCWYTRSRSV